MLKDYWDPFFHSDDGFWNKWKKEDLSKIPDSWVKRVTDILELELGLRKELLEKPILSVGSGSGAGFLQSALWKRGYRIISLDVYLEPLKNIPLEDPKVQADAKALPFKDGTFYVVIGDGLLDIPNKEVPFGESLDSWLKQRWLREISRVIKKKGCFLHHGGSLDEVRLQKDQEAQCGFQKIVPYEEKIWIFKK